ncbi:unnamed protein product [Protopolystoma xenopodis]|uniref:Uncharacterized protein n=1 Tax=Protopolystoma xenopodis TaxID=117903 RepID=A0A3S5FC91_9PLAT|nr:unnamed protein product [Protopolystoma xenopodis]
MTELCDRATNGNPHSTNVLPAASLTGSNGLGKAIDTAPRGSITRPINASGRADLRLPQPDSVVLVKKNNSFSYAPEMGSFAWLRSKSKHLSEKSVDQVG